VLNYLTGILIDILWRSAGRCGQCQPGARRPFQHVLQEVASVFHLTPMPFRHPRTMKLIEPRRRHGRKAFELFFAIMASLRFRSFYLSNVGP
jgi:hypothetical protein